MNDALSRLASAAGIEPGYWDGLGQWRELGVATTRTLLVAMGFDPDVDPDAQRRRLECGGRHAGAPLPPAVVLRCSDRRVAPLAFRLTLPSATVANQPSAPIGWEVLTESGEARSGAADGSRIAHAGDFHLGGVDYIQRDISAGIDLPCGVHRLSVPAFGAATTVIVAPARCHIPAPLAAGGRIWGIAVQLYALRSGRNWGMGDFTDLAQFARLAGRLGAGFVGLNPLHARHLARPDEASPYAPSSRLFLDVMYLDVEAVEGYAACAPVAALVQGADFRARLAAARAAPLVDHDAVFALKMPALELLFHAYRARRATPEGAAEAAAFAAFRARHGQALERYAEFEALRLDWLELTGALPPWPEWPPEWRDPDSEALRHFREDAAPQIEFQVWLQWQAERQFDAAAAAGREEGLRLGLYRDLAVGATVDSAEAWGDQSLMAAGVNLGAPPDLLAREGQNWGLLPWNPHALPGRAYRPLAALLDANMRGAGALRIDHVMSLLRLFWIPAGHAGSDGGYVRFPFEALTAVVALASERNRCMVVGEDLGSVPDGLRERLHDLGFLSYRVLIFERHWQGDGRFKRPWEYPAQALATVATHDIPTLADYWQGGDIARRDRLGLFAERRLRDDEAGRREAERDQLRRLLDETQLRPDDAAGVAGIVASLHAVIARTPSMLAVVQLDDVLGETEPANIPGTYREYPNWRRKLSVSLEELERLPALLELARIMAEAGRA
jgi:4-alpha-glucanotransferase